MSAAKDRTWVYYGLVVDGQVATLRFKDRNQLPPDAAQTEPHWELAELLWAIAFDDSIRVVVLRGAGNGVFLAPSGSHDGAEVAGPGPRTAHWLWRVSTGVVRSHYAMALLDKPVVACIDGPAIGIGAAWMFAADIIIARDDARIVDNHMGMGEVSPWHWLLGVVPGDGGAALVPEFLSPARAKEFLMLAREYDARELERLGAINWAVPPAELDAKVEETVQALLRRSAYALAWTKRVANKALLDQLNRTLDAGISYELVNMLEFSASGSDSFEL